MLDIIAVQKIVDALDDEYGGQLTIKEQELQSVQEDLNAVTQELESTRKGLEERQAQSQKLSEAQQKTKNIENALQIGWSHLEHVMKQAGKPMPSLHEIENIDENEDIDALFDVPELVLSENATEEEKKNQLESYVKSIQARVKAYTTNDQELQKEIKELEDQFVEKEMQCKRLIAACCNLPIDKIDDLVEPLTLAIESDPPDLDLARVIGFMDKIRRQGAFAEPGTSDIPSNITPLIMSDSPTIVMTHDHDTIMEDVPNPAVISPTISDGSPALNKSPSHIVVSSPRKTSQPDIDNASDVTNTNAAESSIFSSSDATNTHKSDFVTNTNTNTAYNNISAPPSQLAEPSPKNDVKIEH